MFTRKNRKEKESASAAAAAVELNEKIDEKQVGETVCTLLMWCFSERDVKAPPVRKLLLSVFDKYYLTNYQINQLYESHPLYNSTTNDVELYNNIFINRLKSFKGSATILHDIKVYSIELEKKIKENVEQQDEGEGALPFETFIQQLSQDFQTRLSGFVRDIYLHWQKEERSAIIEVIESMILVKIFGLIFPIDKEKDSEASQAINFVKTNHEDFLSDVSPRQVECIQWDLAIAEISHINLFQTPRDKMMCILRASRIIGQGLKDAGKLSGAEEFTSCLYHVVMKANPSYLYSNLKCEDLLTSEPGYYFVALQGALQYMMMRAEKLAELSNIIVDDDFVVSEMPLVTQVDRKTALTASIGSLSALMTTDSDSDESIEDGSSSTIQQKDKDEAKLAEQSRRILNVLVDFAIGEQMTISYDSRLRAALRRLALKMNPDEAGLQIIGAELEAIQAKITKTIDAGDHRIRNVFDRTKSNHRALKVAMAAIAGGSLLALTGGLAAPLIGAALFHVGAGTAIFSVLTATGVSGTALTSVLFGAAGGMISADRMNRHTSGLGDFSISKINETFGLHVVIGVQGWVEHPDGVQDKAEWELNLLNGVLCLGEVYTISWENQLLYSLFDSLKNYKLQVEDNNTFAKFTSKMMHDAILPSASILEAGSIISTCWGQVKDRAQRAGKLLADELIERRFGSRPITLIGVSMGSRLIYFCLLELVKQKQYGIIENLIFIGSPIPVDLPVWAKIRMLYFVQSFHMSISTLAKLVLHSWSL
eukprot:gene7567-8853_t